MIWQVEGLGYNVETVAKNLNVDKSTVYRILQRFVSTGSVAKSSYPAERAVRKLTNPAKLFSCIRQARHIPMQNPRRVAVHVVYPN